MEKKGEVGPGKVGISSSLRLPENDGQHLCATGRPRGAAACCGRDGNQVRLSSPRMQPQAASEVVCTTSLERVYDLTGGYMRIPI